MTSITWGILEKDRYVDSRYSAPEQHDFPPILFTTQTDIYSLGKIFLFLALREYYFHGIFNFSEIRNKTSLKFASLIQACLNSNPAKRPTAQRVCVKLEKMIELEKSLQKRLKSSGVPKHPLPLLRWFSSRKQPSSYITSPKPKQNMK